MAKKNDVKLINVPFKAVFRIRHQDGSLGRKRYKVIWKNKAMNTVDVSRDDIAGIDYFKGKNGNQKVHVIKPRKHKKGRMN